MSEESDTASHSVTKPRSVFMSFGSFLVSLLTLRFGSEGDERTE